ncbi:HPP family protein [Sulfuriferula sp. AH1]|uniref:HPP family protein n=1 Tax=Sulfuriferula sp. AH1 TaxID=1985873 RepID=UPI0012FB49B2|nr:HPP family protein [Sulfuriferula sp. AH1]
MLRKLLDLAGVDFTPISHGERWISISGAFFGILLVYLCSSYFLHGQDVPLVVASMGASAVLLFAVPHGALSQPWALVGGQLISALIGVTCSELIPQVWLAVPVAVALAVGAMHYLRCIHPPGGATALVAAMGGPELHALGYGFVLEPVLLNVLVILVVAVVFSWMFPWRRYPAFLSEDKVETPSEIITAYPAISHEDFVYALSQIDSFIDVNEHDLMRIYQLATKHHTLGNELASTSPKKHGCS